MKFKSKIEYNQINRENNKIETESAINEKRSENLQERNNNNEQFEEEKQNKQLNQENKENIYQSQNNDLPPEQTEEIQEDDGKRGVKAWKQNI